MPCVSWAPKVSWMSTGERGHSGPGAGTGPVMLDGQVLPTQDVWLAGASGRSLCSCRQGRSQRGRAAWPRDVPGLEARVPQGLTANE